MKQQLSEFESKCFDFLSGKISGTEFEAWLFGFAELENILNQDDYTEILALNYNTKWTRHDAEKILGPYLDFGKYETVKLLDLLYTGLNSKPVSGNILREFYNMYCSGYYFLQDLGLGYGLNCEVPIAKYKADSWDELNTSQREELINSFFPQVEIELQRVINWLNNGKIVLTGEQNDIGHYLFIDNRTEDEK